MVFTFVASLYDDEDISRLSKHDIFLKLLICCTDCDDWLGITNRRIDNDILIGNCPECKKIYIFFVEELFKLTEVTSNESKSVQHLFEVTYTHPDYFSDHRLLSHTYIDYTGLRLDVLPIDITSIVKEYMGLVTNDVIETFSRMVPNNFLAMDYLFYLDSPYFDCEIVKSSIKYCGPIGSSIKYTSSQIREFAGEDTNPDEIIDEKFIEFKFMYNIVFGSHFSEMRKIYVAPINIHWAVVKFWYTDQFNKPKKIIYIR